MGPDSLPVSTRSALRKAGAGEIVEVQGGHIVRATGRKDRHSKVCTAKGPRDRRVRLSANTAIQFYDVQDRLGYDRPSKAVDWLIKKAKAAIDELDELPAWSPTNMNICSSSRREGKSCADSVAEMGTGGPAEEGKLFGGADKDAHRHQGGDEHHQQQRQQIFDNSNNTSHFSLLPPSLDSDAIADTIKSFFPMGGSANAGEVGLSTTTSASPPSLMQFQDYSQRSLLPRSGGSNTHQSQDLRLSLQSFQDPILMHSHHQTAHDEQQYLFPGAAPVGFVNTNADWTDGHHQSNPEIGRLHRLVVGWNNDTGTDNNNSASGIGASRGSTGGGGFMFNPPPLLQPLFGGHHSQLFTQRGPLQSSNAPSIRTWIVDPIVGSTSEQHQGIPLHPQALSGIGFSSSGFSDFHIPARIQGEEEQDGDPTKPSSASSGSCH